VRPVVEDPIVAGVVQTSSPRYRRRTGDCGKVAVRPSLARIRTTGALSYGFTVAS